MTRLLRTSVVVVVALALAVSLRTVAGAAGATAGATVTVNASQHYQSIAGFGVSEGFGQAKALMSAPASVQDQVLTLLYSPAHGAGLTILRNEISADAGFTIEPRAPNGPNAKPSYLSLAQVDQDQGQLWFAQRIKADYGVSDVPGFRRAAECCASVGWGYAQQYATAIEADKAADAATALFTSHGYFVAPGSPLRGWAKPVWETEWAPFDTGPFD